MAWGARNLISTQVDQLLPPFLERQFGEGGGIFLVHSTGMWGCVPASVFLFVCRGDRVPVEENLPSHRRRCVDTRPATQVLRATAYCCRIYL